MNTNCTFTCDVCEQDTDCRIGYSNREIQPLCFACPHCSSLMQITLNIQRAPQSDFSFTGCRPSETQPVKTFDGSNPFVDLHLDFPVRFCKYVMGNTPYLMAMQDLKDTSADDDKMSFLKKMDFNNNRLTQLNHFHDKSHEIKTIIRLYNGKNKQLFLKRVSSFLDEDQGSSLEPQDVNATLYKFVSNVFLPFIHFNEVKDVVNGFSGLMTSLPTEPLDSFMQRVISTDFLKTLQKDCLKIYPEIYSAEMPMRPALFIDLIPTYEKAKVASRISTDDFQTYKDLYKDIIEVFSRQLIIVAGINNIIHRGDHDSFQPISGKALSSLDKFASKTLSEKFKYLDECWYPIEINTVDTGVRNAIAHNNVEYNDVSQQITYYPNGGNIQPSEGQQIFFLDFMRMILTLFREMHNLHHVIKCLFYYEFLVRSK